MPTLLVVHHTPSPTLQEMFEAAVSGARTDQVEGVEVIIRPALTRPRPTCSPATATCSAPR